MKSYTAVALTALTLVGAAAPSQITPVATYGEGRSFGGSFALHEIVLGDAKPQLKAIQEAALAAYHTLISEAPDSKYPKTAPVTLITAGANIGDVQIDREKTAEYLENGGMLIIDCRDQKASEKMRGWLQSVVPNRPLVRVQFDTAVGEWIHHVDKRFIDSPRRHHMTQTSADVIKADGKIRAAVFQSGGHGFMAETLAISAALRSPHRRVLPAPPVQVSAKRSKNHLIVEATVPDGTKYVNRMRAVLYGVDGKELARGSKAAKRAGGSWTLRLKASIKDKPFQPNMLWARVEGMGPAPYRGTFAMSELIGSIRAELKGQTTWIAGSPAEARVFVKDNQESPYENANVSAEASQNGKTLAEAKATTGADGSARLRFELPEDAQGDVQLRVLVRTERGDEELTSEMRIEARQKIMLTMDKPTYQPGQRMRLRALSLRAGDLQAQGGGSVVFEVEDSKGNKVFKREAERNEFGVASAEFQLASEVNMGTYTVRVISDGQTEEKSASVERYALPKFKAKPTLERAYYRPGETVSGTVQADYFFGKPVSEATVKIAASKFDTGWDEFATFEGKTDESGACEFEMQLPKLFAGLPLEQGDSFALFSVTVTDGAGQSESTSVSAPVVETPLSAVLLPESGRLIPNVENEIYAVISYPDGSPAERVKASLTLGGDTKTAETDSMGSALFRLTPNEAAEARLEAKDAAGNALSRTINLETETDALLLRPNQALLKAGDRLEMTVFSPDKTGWVYVDAIREGQTIYATAAELKGGRAQAAMPVGPGDFGSLTLHAYQTFPDGQIRRDTRRVFASPADDLTIEIRPDQNVYLPGEEAQIDFQVKNREGSPVFAALGVQMVDEAVFARVEAQPGFERVFFLLEKELLTPRVQITELQPELIAGPMPRKAAAPNGAQRREQAARLLFAAADTAHPEYTLTKQSTSHTPEGIQEALRPIAENGFERFKEAVAKAAEKLKADGATVVSMAELIEGGHLPEEALIDPWGNRLTLRYDDWSHYRYIVSLGPDGRLGTEDDVWLWMDTSRNNFSGELMREDLGMRVMTQSAVTGGAMLGRGSVRRSARLMERAALESRAPARPPVALQRRMKYSKLELEAVLETDAAAAPADSAAPPRLREYFPETLFVMPSLLTDEKGHAQLNVPLADSITTWQLAASASTKGGLLGSASAGVRVFQDFFIDIDLPSKLTQGDEVSMPIALYNYLETPQTIRLEIDEADWFEPLSGLEMSADLQPGEVTVRYFRVKAEKHGRHAFTARAYGSSKSDAVRRDLQVTPNGRRFELTMNGRLGPEAAKRTAQIPASAVPGASQLFLKVYPGAFSQLADGLDAILRMPSGCFEQTSSSTYPNILALDYMRETKQISPEIQLKAEQYINLGYQRLLSFEVDGGGFSWFGNAPANKILTAYGLMEFADMSRVHEVDPALIKRTQEWLVSTQRGDGSWAPDEGYLHRGVWGRIQSSELLPTAYIVWALASSGYEGEPLTKGVDYLKTHWKAAEDPYMLSMVCNALVNAAPKDSAADDAMARLVSMAKRGGDGSYWASGMQTMTYAREDAANLEATGLAALALLQWRRDPMLTERALTYLMSMRDPRGTWHTTQATVLALKALLKGSSGAVGEADGTVTALLNGREIGKIQIAPENSDVAHLLALSDGNGGLKSGTHEVEIRMDGTGKPAFQIFGRYYMPWGNQPQIAPPLPAFDVSVSYDRSRLVKDETVKATCVFRNPQDMDAKMVVIDLGIPPGFAVQPADFERLVTERVVQKFEIAPRQVILYFDEVRARQTVEFEYSLRAKFPLRAQTGESKAYEYYNPQRVAYSEPVEVNVTQER